MDDRTCHWAFWMGGLSPMTVVPEAVPEPQGEV